MQQTGKCQARVQSAFSNEFLLFVRLTYKVAKRICHMTFLKRHSETNERTRARQQTMAAHKLKTRKQKEIA